MEFSLYIQKLQKIYQDHDQTLTLFAPVSSAEIRKAEKQLGFFLDPALISAWSVTGGCDSWQPVFIRPGYCTGYDFLSLSEAMDLRAGMKKRASQYVGYKDPEPRNKRIKPGWFQEGWLPFAAFAGSDLILLQDYSPASKGKAGQIIAFTHDPDEISYVAADFSSFLKQSMKEIAADPEELFA